MSQYERNKRWKEKNRAKVAENQRRYREGEGLSAHKQAFQKRLAKIVAWYREYKLTLKCGRCPESHPAALAFHHRDPALKKDTIPRMVYNAYGIKTVMAEIAKCDVLCHNCHAKLHWDENQYTSEANP